MQEIEDIPPATLDKGLEDAHNPTDYERLFTAGDVLAAVSKELQAIDATTDTDCDQFINGRIRALSNVLKNLLGE